MMSVNVKIFQKRRAPKHEVVWWGTHQGATTKFKHTEFIWRNTPYGIQAVFMKNNKPLTESVMLRAEKALGVTFTREQRLYLTTDNWVLFGRQEGATTAYIIGLLLSFDPDLVLRLSLTSECAYVFTDWEESKRYFQIFLHEVDNIYTKLLTEFKEKELVYLILFKG